MLRAILEVGHVLISALARLRETEKECSGQGTMLGFRLCQCSLQGPICLRSRKYSEKKKCSCFHCGRDDFSSEPSGFKIEIHSAEVFHLTKIEHNREKGGCLTIVTV